MKVAQISQEEKRNFVGIDIGKRKMDICRIYPDQRKERFKLETNKNGLKQLIKLLKPNDTVSIEAGNQTFRIVRQLKKETKSTIYILNPGNLATIYASLKKTDKEDALKLARIVARFPKEELPIVELPSNETEEARRLMSVQGYYREQITAIKNRIHSLFTQAGLTEIRKKDIKNKKTRKTLIALLPEGFIEEVKMSMDLLEYFEKDMDKIVVKIQEILKENLSYMTIVMSMPGIGILSSMAVFSYIGDGKRFSKPKQVSYYAGLVPRVDMSGTINRYGRITKRGPKHLRRILIQSAWALVKSKHGGVLKDKYESLKNRIGKNKAIVAIARKMLESLFVMIQTGELYRGVPIEILDKKLAYYGIL